LRRLDELGHRNKISKYIILSSSSDPFVKDSVAFENKKEYFSLKEAFGRKHSRTVKEHLFVFLTS